MGKASTITCKTNRNDAVITGDWVQTELIDLTITGVTFAADGTFLLALLYPGQDDVQASTDSDGSTALSISGSDLTGVLNLNTAEIAARFADTTRDELPFWLQLQDTTNNKTYMLRKITIYRSQYTTGMGAATDGNPDYLTTAAAAATYATIAALNALALNDLSNVSVASPDNGQVLKYNSSTETWEAAAESGAVETDPVFSSSEAASFVAGDKAKLDGVEAGATADQSNSEIETAYNSQVAAASQAEMEAGTEAAIRRMSPLRVAQAIAALAGGGAGAGKTLAFFGYLAADQTGLSNGVEYVVNLTALVDPESGWSAANDDWTCPAAYDGKKFYVAANVLIVTAQDGSQCYSDIQKYTGGSWSSFDYKEVELPGRNNAEDARVSYRYIGTLAAGEKLRLVTLCSAFNSGNKFQANNQRTFLMIECAD
jgi:hypothetical protein